MVSAVAWTDSEREAKILKLQQENGHDYDLAAAMVMSMEPTQHVKPRRTTSTVQGRDVFGRGRRTSSPRATKPSLLTEAADVQAWNPNMFNDMIKWVKNYHNNEALAVIQTIMGSNKACIPSVLMKSGFGTIENEFKNKDSHSAKQFCELALVATALKLAGGREALETIVNAGGGAASVQQTPVVSSETQSTPAATTSPPKSDVHSSLLHKCNMELSPHERMSRYEISKYVNDPLHSREPLHESTIAMYKSVEDLVVAGTPATLTAQQVKRMQQIVKVIQSDASQKLFLESNNAPLYGKLREKLQVFRTTSGDVIWDSSLDKPGLAQVVPVVAPVPAAANTSQSQNVPANARVANSNATISNSYQNPVTPPPSPPAIPYYAASDDSFDCFEDDLMNDMMSSSTVQSRAPAPVERELLTGPRGGTYYWNGSGNKQYVKPQSQSPAPAPAAASNGERVLHTGPRGGTYYINSSGNKQYVKS